MNIRLHPEHGLNPTIPTCFLCGGDKNEIVFLGASAKKITGSEEAPMHGPAIDKLPCDKCKEYMEMGIIMISVKDGETDKDNPYRTGGWWVIKEDAVKRMPIDEDIKAQVIKKRVLFIEDKAANDLGMPRENIDNTKKQEGES